MRMLRHYFTCATPIATHMSLLKVENTGNNFENVKADVKVRGGKWYYEVKLHTYGKVRERVREVTL